MVVPDSTSFLCYACRNEFTPVVPVSPLRIFLSYGHDANEELVLRIKSDLEQRGHDVWFDKTEIKAGDNWRRAITDGILHSQRVVSFLSRHSTRDPGVCRDEIAIAIGVKGGNIQTILVENETEVQPPVNIGHIQWLDMRDWKERRASGESAWEEWYQAKLAEIIRVVENDESRRFAGEIETLNGHLKPIRSDARIYDLLRKGFFGRTWLFDSVERWRSGSDDGAAGSQSRLFWITGDPGVGKSAFAAQLTHTRSDAVIAAQFVEWDKPDHRDAGRVIRSLAFQFATRLPDYRKLLLTLPEIAELDRKDPAELFDYLLANPLRSVIGGGRERQLIVIDALDEAGEAGRNPLVEMLARHATRLPDWLGLVVTSRRESAVKAPLQGLNPFVLDTQTEANRADLRDYLRRQLAPQLHARSDADPLVEQILEKSEGVFLYVERFCDDVQKNHLSLDRPEQFPQGLGGIFYQWFQRQFPDLEKFRKDVRPALRAIVAAREPLPVEILQRLFNWQDEELRDFTRTLGSLFPVTKEANGEVIKAYHKSLADWLTNEAKADAYFVAVKSGHQMLADFGMKGLKAGVDSMPAYSLAQLPGHLLEVEQWPDAVRVLLHDKYLPAALQLKGWGWLIATLGRDIAAGISHGSHSPSSLISILNALRIIRYPLGDQPEWVRFASNALRNYLRRQILYGEKIDIAESLLALPDCDTDDPMHNTRLLVAWAKGPGMLALLGQSVGTVEVDRSADLAATAGSNVCLWQISTRLIRHWLGGNNEPQSDRQFGATAFIRSRGLVAAAQDQTVELWDVDSGELTGSFHSDLGKLAQLKYAPNRDRLLVIGSKGMKSHRLEPPYDCADTFTPEWDGLDPSLIFSDFTGHRESLYLSLPKEIRRIDCTQGTQTRLPIHPAEIVTALACDSTGDWLVTGDEKGNLEVHNQRNSWQRSAQATVVSTKNPEELIDRGMFGMPYREVKMYTGIDSHWLPSPVDVSPAWVQAIAVSPDSRFLAVGSADGLLRLFPFPEIHHGVVSEVDFEGGFIRSLQFTAERNLWVAVQDGDLWELTLDESGKIVVKRLLTAGKSATVKTRFVGGVQLLRAVRGQVPAVSDQLGPGMRLPDGQGPVPPSPLDHPDFPGLTIPMEIEPLATARGNLLCLFPFFVFNQRLSTMLALSRDRPGVAPLVFYPNGSKKPLRFRFSADNWAKLPRLADVSPLDDGKLVMAPSGQIVVLDIRTSQSSVVSQHDAPAPQVGGTQVGSIPVVQPTPEVQHLAVSWDGRHAAADWSDGRLEVIRLDTWPPKVEASVQNKEPLSGFGWAPGGALLLFAKEGGLDLLDPNSNDIRRKATGYTGVQKIVCSATGRLIAAASDKHHRIYIISGTDLSLQTIETHPLPISDMAFSPDETTLYLADVVGNLVAYQIQP